MKALLVWPLKALAFILTLIGILSGIAGTEIGDFADHLEG